MKCAASQAKWFFFFFWGCKCIMLKAVRPFLRARTNWRSDPASGANTPHDGRGVCSGFCMTLHHFIVVLHLSVLIYFFLCSFCISLLCFFQISFFFWSLIAHLNKIPATSCFRQTCVRQISDCPPSRWNIGLNWLEKWAAFLLETGRNVSLGLEVTTHSPFVCRMSVWTVYMETKVHVWTFALQKEALWKKNEMVINLEFCLSQFILSSLLWVVDTVELHQNLWPCDRKSEKNNGKLRQVVEHVTLWLFPQPKKENGIFIGSSRGVSLCFLLWLGSTSFKDHLKDP